MSKEKKYKYLTVLSKKPELPQKGKAISKTRIAAQEFIDSGAKYAEINIEGYDNTTALARSLGRSLHNKNSGLDPKGEIEVRSDPIKGKVYLLKRQGLIG